MDALALPERALASSHGVAIVGLVGFLKEREVSFLSFEFWFVRTPTRRDTFPLKPRKTDPRRRLGPGQGDCSFDSAGGSPDLNQSREPAIRGRREGGCLFCFRRVENVGSREK